MKHRGRVDRYKPLSFFEKLFPQIKKLEKENDIIGLVRLVFQSEKPEVVQKAEQALLRIGPPSADYLKDTLDTRYGRKALRVLEQLGWTPGNATQQANVYALKDDAYGLARLGDERALSGLLSDALRGNKASQLKALETTAMIRSPKTVETLQAFLKYSDENKLDEDLMAGAIRALARVHQSGALNIIQKYKAHPHAAVRRAVIEALEPQLSKTDQETLQQYRGLKQKHDWEAVEKMGASVVDFLIKDLQEDPEPDRQITALANIGDPKAVQPLCELLGKKGERIGEYAVKGLLRLNHLSAAEALIIHLIDESRLCAFGNDSNESYYYREYQNLFLDFTSLIIQIAFIDYTLSDYSWRYHFNKNFEALETLSRMNESPLASNLLHLVSKRHDLSQRPATASEWGITGYTSVNLQKMRDFASQELARRNNPPYDSQAYLARENWLLK